MIRYTRLALSAALLLVLSAILTACAGMQQATASEVIEKLRETMKSTQTVQGTVELSLTVNKEGLQTLAEGMMPENAAGEGRTEWAARLPDAASATLKVWRQSPDKARIEVESSTIPGAKGATLVCDGEKFYAYDPARNTVYTGTPEEMDHMQGELSGLLESANFEKSLDKLISAANFVMAGSEKVDNLDAYKLDVTPKPDAAELLGLPEAARMQAGVLIKDLRATLWVDKDRWIPLKWTLEHPNAGTLTYTATSLELNKPIDPAQFVLQAPGDAKRVDLDAKRREMEPESITIQEARDLAAKDSWKLLEPTYLPDNATLVEVSQMTHGEGTSFELRYHTPTSDFSIVQMGFDLGSAGRRSDTTEWHFLGSGVLTGDGDESKIDPRSASTKEVIVRGKENTAFLYSIGEDNVVMLSWLEGTGMIAVHTRGQLSLEEVIKIADSLK